MWLQINQERPRWELIMIFYQILAVCLNLVCFWTWKIRFFLLLSLVFFSSHLKQLNFVLPPTNPNVPIRETENMRLAMDAILKLTFSEMIALGRDYFEWRNLSRFKSDFLIDALLRKESATPPLDAYALCGLPTPQKPWWCYKDRNPGFVSCCLRISFALLFRRRTRANRRGTSCCSCSWRSKGRKTEGNFIWCTIVPCLVFFLYLI